MQHAENKRRFVLPGNPVSHFVTLQVAVRLALELFAGAKDSWPLAKIRLAENFEFYPNPRETFWPARVTLKMANWLRAPCAGKAPAT
ncbi:MAG: hypothetical protein WDM76_02600 [Limisphaerales bacterium]